MNLSIVFPFVFIIVFFVYVSIFERGKVKNSIGWAFLGLLGAFPALVIVSAAAKQFDPDVVVTNFDVQSEVYSYQVEGTTVYNFIANGKSTNYNAASDEASVNLTDDDAVSYVRTCISEPDWAVLIWSQEDCTFDLNFPKDYEVKTR